MIASRVTLYCDLASPDGPDDISARHPGDSLSVVVRSGDGASELAFFGPPDAVIDTLQRLLWAAYEAVGKPEAEMA